MVLKKNRKMSNDDHNDADEDENKENLRLV